METVILEKLIIKIGALLAVGFGEAGSEIVAKNMRKGNNILNFYPFQYIDLNTYYYYRWRGRSYASWTKNYGCVWIL